MLGPDRRAADDRAPTTRRGLLLATLAGLTGCTAERSSDARAATVTSHPTPTQTATRAPTPRPTAAVERFDGPLAVPADARALGRRLGRPLADFATLDRWRPSGAALGSGPPRDWGGRTARLTVPASDEVGGVYRAFPDGLDLTDRAPSLAVRAGETDAPSGIYCQLYAPDAENRIDLWQAISHHGWVRLDLGPREVVGDPDLRDVREIGLRVWAGEDRVRLGLDALRTVERPARGAVMFTFDDGVESQYDPAAGVLADHDAPGVIAPIPDTVGDEGRVTLDQLRELRDDGWTVVNHPQLSHPLPDCSPERQRAALERTKRWLLDEGFERGADTVIWPYGEADATTLSIARRYFSVGLSAGAAPSALPVTDPLTVARVDGTQVERARRALDLAERYRALVVLAYHPVDTDDGNAVSEEDLRETVAHATRLDLDVVTPCDLAPTPP